MKILMLVALAANAVLVVMVLKGAKPSYLTRVSQNISKNVENEGVGSREGL